MMKIEITNANPNNIHDAAGGSCDRRCIDYLPFNSLKMEELNFITVCFTAGVAACAAVIELAEENTYPAGIWLCCLIANINMIIELA